MFTTCPKIRNTICRKVFFFGTKSVSLKCQFIHVYVIIRKIRKRVTWSDDDTNLLASNVLIVPEPEASDHCGACSPSHSRWSMWTPPAEGTPACRSARSWIQTPIGNVLLHLEYRWDKRKWHTVFHHTLFFFFFAKVQYNMKQYKNAKKKSKAHINNPWSVGLMFHSRWRYVWSWTYLHCSADIGVPKQSRVKSCWKKF